MTEPVSRSGRRVAVKIIAYPHPLGGALSTGDLDALQHGWQNWALTATIVCTLNTSVEMESRFRITCKAHRLSVGRLPCPALGWADIQEITVFPAC